MKRKHFVVLCFFVCANLLVYSQPESFAPRGVGGGGALFFPRINPANDNEFYIACDMSELFHSSDFGNTYSQLHFSKLPVGNTSTYEFTNNPLIAYSNFSDGNDGYPVKTTDGGNSWQKLPGFEEGEGAIYAMKANYNNPSQLLMDYYGKIVFSNNGGATFTDVKTAADNGAGIIMGGAFFDGTNIYIGSNNGIIYSTNSGGTWSTMAVTGLQPNEVIWQFAAAKAGTTLRFACITSNISDTYNGIAPWDYDGFFTNVYTMDNAGGTWVNKTGTIDVSSDFVMYIGMAENDINTIYLGGNDGNLDAPLIYKTTNAGIVWNKVFNTTSNANIITGWEGWGGDKQWSWGEAVFGLAVAPGNSGKIVFGNYSDVHVSSDGGATWKQSYVNNTDQHPAGSGTPKQAMYHSIGLENTTCWQVYWINANNIFSAYSDIGGIRSMDGGNSWGFNYNGMSTNSIYRIAGAAGGTLFAATSGIHDMYQSTRLADAVLDAADANGRIMYSTDNGSNWSLLHAFGHPVFWLAVDPGNSNKMYASVIDHGGGNGGIWMTGNLNSLSGSTWTKLPAPPRTEGHPASVIVLNDGNVVCTFSGRRINDNTNPFTESSGVFLYNPVTNGWTDVSDANQHYWTKDIVIDPADATQNTWYACVFSHWGSSAAAQGGLYRSADRGASWTKLTGTLFDRVTSITFNPKNNKEAFITTETQGLWFSSNMDATTPGWSLVNSYPFRQPERVYFNPYNENEVWISSFGNGMKVGYMESGSLPVVLQSFTVQEKDCAAFIKWSTGSESNNDFFKIERSSDGIHFTAITKVKGAGNSNMVNQYSYTDPAPGDGVHYYRLLQADEDGKQTYYATQRISIDCSAATTIKISPNPVNHILNIDGLKGKCTVRITNISGQTVINKVINNNSSVNIDVSSFSAGIYYVQLIKEEKIIMKYTVVKL